MSFEKRASSAVLTEAFLKRDGIREEEWGMPDVRFHLLKLPPRFFCVLSLPVFFLSLSF